MRSSYVYIKKIVIGVGKWKSSSVHKVKWMASVGSQSLNCGFSFLLLRWLFKNVFMHNKGKGVYTSTASAYSQFVCRVPTTTRSKRMRVECGNTLTGERFNVF